jgi:hypothetical protein
VAVSPKVGFPKQVLPPPLRISSLRRRDTGGGEERGRKNVPQQTSDQERLPAEFKHITKRRRRN